MKLKCSIVDEITSTLYKRVSPYENADLSYVDLAYPDSHIDEELLEVLFSHIKPEYILECGSMIGTGSIQMIQLCDRLNLDTCLVCLDPFTGDVNMWEWENTNYKVYKYLQLENGVPTIYKRFLANIKKAGLEKRIVPINCTTTVGIKLLHRLFQKKRISHLPNYIYLDSAHEPFETYVELLSSWALLKKGSVLFGDDWSWSAIKQDVTELGKSITVDYTRLTQLHQSLPGSSIEGKILLYKDHWVLFK